MNMSSAARPIRPSLWRPVGSPCTGPGRVAAFPLGPLLLLLLVIVAAAPGCSVRRMAVNKLGDALSAGGTTFASDDDPELIRAAIPFSLKLMESLLAESPNHRGLRYATASGFTQYGYAFVQQDADELEAKDVAAGAALRQRAQKLYLRARNHGLRGLEAKHPRFEQALRADAQKAVRSLRKAEVPLAYWTAAAWGAAISVSKNNPELIADVPLVEALIDRAAELEPDYSNGAIHGFLITFEMSRQGASGNPAARSRAHFERAVALTGGQSAAPYLSLAEAVAVKEQDRALFDSLLQKALAINVDAKPEWRLSNLVMQRRARWLAARADDLILPPLPAEDPPAK